MKTKDIKLLLNTKPYDFLKTNEHLGKNIMYLTMGGSIAYGTNLPGKGDVDIRGIFYNSPIEILNMEARDKPFEHKATDTVIYPFRQLVKLLLNSNPNIVELFGTKEDHVFKIDKNSKMLRDNMDLFLSQKVKLTFGGYAVSQLRRLQNALAHDKYPQIEKEKHILGSLNSQMAHLQRVYSDFDENQIKLSIDDTNREGYEKEIYMDIELKHYPMRDFKAIYSEMSNVIKDYDKLNHRNNKKDDLHLNKHSMHLVRLMLMLIDILSTGKVITYRENDRDFLLSIRNGHFQMEDGNYRKEFFELINDLENKIDYAYKHTVLPVEPDIKKIQEIVYEINLSLLK